MCLSTINPDSNNDCRYGTLSGFMRLNRSATFNEERDLGSAPNYFHRQRTVSMPDIQLGNNANVIDRALRFLETTYNVQCRQEIRGGYTRVAPSQENYWHLIASRASVNATEHFSTVIDRIHFYALKQNPFFNSGRKEASKTKYMV